MSNNNFFLNFPLRFANIIIFFLQFTLVFVFYGYLIYDAIRLTGLFNNFKNKFKQILDFLFYGIIAPLSIVSDFWRNLRKFWVKNPPFPPPKCPLCPNWLIQDTISLKLTHSQTKRPPNGFEAFRINHRLTKRPLQGFEAFCTHYRPTSTTVRY